ncbi:hypothetical protein Tco_0705550 [Tanacetum coccineum]|uniref:Uncharacterized protein n=1 Tax=Tanacetum coccineum TaxID=301880 RepID=A0ABQ4Y523_9ASTR
MVAPSGRGLILYQAYGNLYAMTGRKAHLLEDKNSKCRVFSTWMTFRGNTCGLDHLEKKRMRLRTCTKIHQEVLFSERGDGVTSIKQRRLSGDGVWILATASQHSRLKALENQLLSVSLLTHLGKRKCIERIS